MLFTAKQTVQADHGLLATHPPPYTPGPYTAVRASPVRVPSLVSLCVCALVPFPEQVHRLPVRLHPRFLDELIPDHPSLLDPRLWAVIVQIFDPLPASLASCTLPLADTHLPLLQTIPATPAFSLLTLLALDACPHLTDDSIVHLKFLHTLAALDASNNNLSSYAIQSLAATLDSQDIRGPWHLRILSLRNCRQVTNDAFPHLLRFPLLSVIDLRGTRCLPNSSIPFKPCSFDDLYHPTSLSAAISTLYDVQFDLFSSPNPAVLNIDTLYHPSPKSSAPVTPQDALVVIPSDRSRIKVGNAVLLEKQTQAREEEMAHERNKAAWYDRHERLETRSTSSHYRTERRVGETWTDNVSLPTGFQTRPMSHLTVPARTSAAFQLGEPAARTGVAMGTALNSAQTGISTDQFYKRIPRVSSKTGNPTSSLRLERRRIPESLLSSLNNDDDCLRLYRPPPPWSALEETLLILQEQEARAKQQRVWQRQSAAAEKQDGEWAVVDMNSARAARVKRELERVVEEAAKRRKATDVEYEIEQGLRLNNRYSRSAIPMSNLSISSASSSPAIPPQPLVTESTSKNPFRRRHRSFPASSAPVPVGSASASPSSVDNDIPMQTPVSGPGVPNDGTKSQNKLLVPISSLVVPTLTPEMKKGAAENNGKKMKSTSKTPGNVRNSKSSDNSSQSQFDWKSWGKPAS
ncbi:hypothetical protein CPB84DRAFT_1846509 [Gymnopilus junonius]|uniref:Uncharacterized protein n=1 Tax=Gymnopilus junonius TaxID=109634 RepID=A0A9P5NQG7_GYMJU|nr:hypothetical protein CPB84DRAFT_1846509 [Gymnopilus junonius]